MSPTARAAAALCAAAAAGIVTANPPPADPHGTTPATNTSGGGGHGGGGHGHGCPATSKLGNKCYLDARRPIRFGHGEEELSCVQETAATEAGEHDICKKVIRDGLAECQLEVTCPCHQHEHAHEYPYNIMTLTCILAVANLCRHWGSKPPFSYLPFTVQLFILGALWGWFCRAIGGGMSDYEELSNMDPHLMFFIFLPLLIFESAFATEYHVFKKVVWHCLCLAGPGLIFSTAMTAMVAKMAFSEYGWTWVTCLLFGCMLSATDPVAVVALLKELGASPTISSLIEGESLLNDGTAIVFFNIFKSGVASNYPNLGYIDMTWYWILAQLIIVACGGALLGWVMGIITKTCIKATFNDAPIEITLTVVSAYATFFIAESGVLGMPVSGVLGLVVLGMYLSYHCHVISPEVEHSLHQFWEIICYIANSFIFAIAGLIIAEKVRFVAAEDEDNAIRPTDYGYLLILYVSVNIIRGLSLFMLRGLMNSLGDYYLDSANGILCTWGGLRGAVGLALALIVLGDPEILCAYPDLGSRFLFHTAGLVTLTLCVNGVTTGKVVHHLGLTKVSHSKKFAMQSAMRSLMKHCADRQMELRRQPVFRDVHWTIVNENCTRGMVDPHNRKEELVPPLELQKDACEHYYRAYEMAVEHEYEAGTMRARAQRRLLAYLADSEDNAYTLDVWDMIEARVLDDLFHVTWQEIVPCCGGVSAKFMHAFDVCIGFLNTHQCIIENIDSMCFSQKAASRVKDHCKRVRNDTIALSDKISAEHPEVSMSIKSINACRNVLNCMRNTVMQNHHNGKITAADANTLRMQVEESMHTLRRIPRRLHPSRPEVTLCQLCPWYGEIPEAHERLQMIYAVETIEKDGVIVDEHREGLGTWVVLSGVAKVQLGNRQETFGPGYSAGLLSLVTDKKGMMMHDVQAATTCSVAYFPELSMRNLMSEFPDFNNVVWDEACRGAAQCIMSVLAQYRSWSHVKIANFCKKGYRIALPDTSTAGGKPTFPIQLPPLHVCFLCYGKWKDTLMGHNSGEGPCHIPKQFEDVYLWQAPVLFAIPNPLKVSEVAQQHWKKIRGMLFVAQSIAAIQSDPIKGHMAGKQAVVEIFETGRFFKLIADAKLIDAPGAAEWRAQQEASQLQQLPSRLSQAASPNRAPSQHSQHSQPWGPPGAMPPSSLPQRPGPGQPLSSQGSRGGFGRPGQPAGGAAGRQPSTRQPGAPFQPQPWAPQRSGMPGQQASPTSRLDQPLLGHQAPQGSEHEFL